MNQIENRNNIILNNLDRFIKYYPNIRDLAMASNLRLEIEKEFN